MVTRRAAQRLRVERLKNGLFRVFIAMALCEALWAAVLLHKREWIACFPGAVLAVLIAFLGVAGWECLRPPNLKWVRHQIDRRLGLPDIVISTGEISGESSWLVKLRAEAQARVGSVDWSQVWPTPWPKWSFHSFISSVALFALLGYL